MTIDVTIKREDDGQPERKLHVATMDRDVYGNPSSDVRDIKALAAGESVTLCIHDMRDLRVYETELDLPYQR